MRPNDLPVADDALRSKHKRIVVISDDGINEANIVEVGKLSFGLPWCLSIFEWSVVQH